MESFEAHKFMVKMILTCSVGQEEDRVIKHYIMTHPEKFIEPERIKYGDKRVFLDWSPARN